MKKKVSIILLCIAVVLGMTGCGKAAELDNVDKNSNSNIVEDQDTDQGDVKDNNENKNRSEFEKAIENYKNAKSMTIELEHESNIYDDNYSSKSKAEILIDFQNGFIDYHTTYFYVNSIPGSGDRYDSHEYYDIKNNKAYAYDKECKTWYYYKISYKDDNRFLSYLDKILSLKEEDAKKVGNDYHFGGKDIMIEDDKITWFRIEDIGTQKISEYAEYSFKSFNSTNVTLPSDVKKAVPEKELCD